MIGKLIEGYKYVDDKPLGERNPKWLQDDYVKFIAFAQERIRKTGEGVVGYITNHGYLDNSTFRGMRQSLMQTFTDIYVLDLHGSAKKKEKSPDGSADQNVFEIQPGVAILLCVKEKGRAEPAHVYHAHLWGRQADKYEALREADVSATQWTELQPSSPTYFFVPQNTDLLPEYKQGTKVTEIFPINSIGIATARDDFAIHFDSEEVLQIVKDFVAQPTEEARIKYALGADARDWKVELAQRDLRTSGLSESKIKPILYRPFDTRYTYYTGKSRGFHCMPRYNVMRHMLEGSNLALSTNRNVERGNFEHIFCAKHLISLHSVSIKEVNYLFPLYLYPAADSLETERRPNLAPLFIKALAEKLSLPQEGEYRLPRGITPEDIFHYAYAVFHAPTYRERYTEFLKSDFPRLPLTSDLELFRDLSELGKQLVALHLLDVGAAPQLNEPCHPFEGTGDDRVERAKVKWHTATQRVTINATQGFENVPEEVWEFRVGGYQVAEKWLKDRDGRILSYDEQTHYSRVLVALAETIQLMDAIDERIPSWPLQ